ncbi:MAG: replication factor C large subunit [Nanoarchaeota archaeon]|nr:replication factor C large subunit [Nanoarchaeota archaeon]
MTTLCEKYRAKCFEDIKGQEIAVSKIFNFFKNFPMKKSMVLHGPAGNGKTSLVHALAFETNSEIIELNASDLRNRGQIDTVIKSASKQKSLFNENKIILVDEVDGLSAAKDRGGIQELIRVIETSSFPVIATANKIWDKKFSLLRKISELVEMKELKHTAVFEILKTICQKENLDVQNNLLLGIAMKSKGDVRAAINDLQTINSETIHENLDERDREDSIFNIMKQIFKDAVNEETISLYDKVGMPLDEIYLWMDENIPLEYSGEELYKAINCLSKADVFRGRIYRQQYWRFLVYQNFLLSVGIASAKKYPKTGFTSYKKPTRILQIWLINQKRAKLKSIIEKYAKYTHTSKKKTMREAKLLLNIISKKPGIQKEIKLDNEEIGFLEKNYC